jgi:hypothetical protein
LKTFDVGRPSNIRQVSTLGIGGSADLIAASGTHVHLCPHDYDGLRVIDVTDPAQPRLVGDLPPADNGPFAVNIQDMDAAGHYVYLVLANVTLGGRLEIVDVSQPARPRRVGEYRMLQYARGAGSIEVIGNYAYLTSSDHGLEVINVSDPSNPHRVGGNSSFSAYDITAYGDEVFVAAGDDGLIILNQFTELRFGPASVEADGKIRLPIEGACGQRVKLQRSSNLVDWEDWQAMTLGGNATGCGLIDTTAAARQRFYGVVEDKPKPMDEP